MGRLEKRVRALEERDWRVGFEAALQRLGDEDVRCLAGYGERWLAAERADAPKPPRPTPEEREAYGRLMELRDQAIREGWGSSAWRSV